VGDSDSYLVALSERAKKQDIAKWVSCISISGRFLVFYAWPCERKRQLEPRKPPTAGMIPPASICKTVRAVLIIGDDLIGNDAYGWCVGFFFYILFYILLCVAYS
jgi:hypothetical protein